jgi:predicted nucleic acid-binding protein
VILVDTSVWVNHFRRGDAGLRQLLLDEAAGLHPFVLGEVAAGNLRNRSRTLHDLTLLPRIPLAQEDEVHHLLESQRLWSSGLGWVDLHILASSLLFGWNLYSADRALDAAASRLGCRAGL